MNIKEILKKIGEDKELTEEEKGFLAAYDPEKDESRIPKSRLDQEIQKAKSEKERADKLDTELSELKDRLEELENSGKTEAEKARIASEKELNKLKTQIANLEKERDDAKSSLAKSERTSKIAALAQKHGFSDAEYLDYLTSAKSIDIDDENAIGGFMKELTANSPQHFQSRAKSGGGTGKGGGGSQNDVRLKELLGKKELTLQEAAEVAKIQSEDGSEAKGE